MLKPSEREYLGYHSGEETDPDEWKPTEFEIIKRKMYQWIDEKIREKGGSFIVIDHVLFCINSLIIRLTGLKTGWLS